MNFSLIDLGIGVAIQLPKIITTAAAAVGAYVALSGLSAWKKQLKGKTDYELARRYLRSVYKLRDAMRGVRNPFISSDEMFAALKDSGLEESDFENRQKTNRAVYARRWDRVVSATSDLEVELLEAEVSWGKEAVNIQSDLDANKRKLYSSVKMFLEGHYLDDQDEMIYDMGEGDKFGEKVNAAVLKIEQYLKKFLD